MYLNILNGKYSLTVKPLYIVANIDGTYKSMFRAEKISVPLEVATEAAFLVSYEESNARPLRLLNSLMANALTSLFKEGI